MTSIILTDIKVMGIIILRTLRPLEKYRYFLKKYESDDALVIHHALVQKQKQLHSMSKKMKG
jgi:hypothetical protein